MPFALFGENPIGQRCNAEGTSKIIYLSCFTLFTAGFIVEIIMIQFYQNQYLKEQEFFNTTCYYVNGTWDEYLLTADNRIKCTNKCSKSTSYFPCLQIHIAFINPLTKRRKDSLIYDNFLTYRDQNDTTR
ncbi:hypothetical protein Ciccas_005086, partial [Cichlidogyrus casuarinus]